MGAIAIGIAVFFWRKNSKSWDSMWDEASNTASAWGKTASDTASAWGKTAGDTATAWGQNAGDEAGKDADKITGASEDGSKKVSDLADKATDAARSSYGAQS